METEAETRAAISLYHTPWGVGFVKVRTGLLQKVGLPGEGPGELERARLSRRPEPTEADHASAARWASQVCDYFEGSRRGWTVAELEPELEGLGFTAFARAVYRSLLSTRAGETIGYGELAAMAGYPRAARAVGSAMASNPLPVVIPCHRVIRANGSLGRYGFDPGWKSRLLELERASAVRAGNAASRA